MNGSRKPLVGVVVVNWKRRPETLACLRALACIQYPSWFPVLVDNGCADFTAAEIQAMNPRARYLRNATNLGFAGGANLGMREALRHGAQAVWFLNNDTLPEPPSLARLVEAAERDPHTGIAGAKILQAAAPDRLDSVAMHIDTRSGRFRLVGHDEPDTGRYDDLDEVTAVTACAMLVTRTACQRLGGFDERFFSYLEDADLCLRARAAGFRVRAVPGARVLHVRPPATRARQSASSIYYTTRNHLILMHRHGAGGRTRGTARAAWILALSVAYALRAGQDRPRQRLRAVWRAARDYRRGVSGAPGTGGPAEPGAPPKKPPDTLCPPCSGAGKDGTP